RDVVANDVPGRVGRLRVEQRAFQAGDLSPSAYSIGCQFDQQDSAFLRDSKAGLKRCLETHAKFSQRNHLDFHKAPECRWRNPHLIRMLLPRRSCGTAAQAQDEVGLGFGVQSPARSCRFRECAEADEWCAHPLLTVVLALPGSVERETSESTTRPPAGPSAGLHPVGWLCFRKRSAGIRAQLRLDG